MKKILLFALLLASMLVSAETITLKATQFAIKKPGTEFNEWQDSKIMITMDSDKRIITIFSKLRQVIKYIELESDITSDGIRYTSYAVDNNMVTLRLEIYMFKDNRSFFKFCYNNAEYAYQVQDCPDNMVKM